jgi:hypothetical protein
MGISAYSKPTVYNTDKTRITHRNVHEKTKTTGPARGQDKAIDRRSKTRINISKEQTLKGRAPTNSNVSMGPIAEMMHIDLKDEDLNGSEFVSGYQPTNNRMDMIHSEPTGYRSTFNDYNSFAVENLELNPYVNGPVMNSQGQ